jgi:hypothetical protein
MEKEIVDLFLLKKEKDEKMHRKIDEHILNEYLNQPKKEFTWVTPFKALYCLWNASPQQYKLFKRAWDIILQKDDDMPG